MLQILGPLLAFLGLFIGAYFAQRNEARKYRKDKLTEAYSRLLDAAALSSGPRMEAVMRKKLADEPLDAEEIKFFDEAQARFNNANANVAIHGSPQVVTALSTFYDQGAIGLTPAGRDAYVALIRAMRHDSTAANYDAFDQHVDNILVTGPMRRQAMMMDMQARAQAGQAQGKVQVSYNSPDPGARKP